MSWNQPLPFKLWTLEIEDQSDSELRDLQVIQQEFVCIRGSSSLAIARFSSNDQHGGAGAGLNGIPGIGRNLL